MKGQKSPFGVTAAALSILLSPIPASAGASRTGAEEEMAALCRTLQSSRLPFYGEGLARELEQQLAKAPAGASETLLLQGQLGQQLLQLGELDRAIALLERTREEADRHGMAAQHRALLLSSLILAHLQAAEDLNCLLHGSATSCILPIGPGAVHRNKEHARRAGDLSLELLALKPGNAEIAWVLNLARMLTGDFPAGVPEGLRLPTDLFRPAESFTPWPDRSRQLSLSAVDLAGGAVMEDLNGDGLLDLVTSTWDPCDHLKAYRNDGEGGFEETSEAWGLDRQLGGLNLVQADYDDDGRPDLLVLRGGWLFAQGRIRNSLLENRLEPDGSGTFVDVTDQVGLAAPAFPTQTGSWADYDGDGDLDLFVGNESSGEAAYASQLFRNDLQGDGTRRFVDVAPAVGATNDRFTKGVAWGDFDDDGDPDLFVSNRGPNRLYRNDGERFVDVAQERGVVGPDGWTFASWFFDWDNDGDLDLFVADYRASTEAVAASYFGVSVAEGHPYLYRNDGGRFAEISSEVGLTRPLIPMGANYGDLDNDGWLDLYLGTGEPSFQSQVPNVMYRNRQGSSFTDVTFAGGFGHLQKGHGVAFGDLDNDGDQDLLHQLGGFYPADAFRNALFENPGHGRSWIVLRLEGRKANRFGVGARIEARIREGEAERSIHVLAGSGGSFGGSSLQQEIGLGEAARIERLEIRWPGSGTVQTFEAVAVDRFYRLVEGEDLAPLSLPRLRLASGE